MGQTNLILVVLGFYEFYLVFIFYIFICNIFLFFA